MKRDFAGVRVPRYDYERLRSACHYDANFPETFESWLELAAEGSDLSEGVGDRHDHIDVDVDEFLRWCAANAVRPCLPAMQAFLIVKRHSLHHVLQGGV